MAGDVAVPGFQRITVNPQKCGGLPCVRGMRIRVKDVLELIGSGMSIADITHEHPDLEAEDVYECARYAAGHVSHPVIPA